MGIWSCQRQEERSLSRLWRDKVNAGAKPRNAQFVPSFREWCERLSPSVKTGGAVYSVKLTSIREGF